MKALSDAEWEAAYWSRVDKRGPDECWIWRGSLGSKGRAVFSRLRRSLQASHIALRFAGTPRPSLKHGACHTCDNPVCVNPAHLWWGTQKDNMADCIRKGRKAPTPFKTHCKHGHLLAGGNLYVYRGQRWCIECRRRRLRESYCRQTREGVSC